MSNLSHWLKTFEELKEQQQPTFKKHLVAELLNEHEQNIYAVLHAAFILFNGSISQNQERLYSFWLPSVSGELKLSEVINQAQEFDGDKLKEAIALIESKELFELILLDVLVFARLEGELSNDLKQILNEWCQLLKIKQEAIEGVVLISDHILGINEPKQPSLTETVENILKNPVWSEFFIRELTKDSINSVAGGIWSVEKDILDVSGGVSVSNAILVFYNGARVTSYDGALDFNNVGLINPIFDLKSVDISFERVIAKGLYGVHDKITAFSSMRTAEVKVINCHFDLNGSRVFLFDESNTAGLFEHANFHNCGNENLLGGAVKYQQGLKFASCVFSDCISKVGGAVFSKNLISESFVKCRFVDNVSITEWEEGINAGCLYSFYGDGDKAMVDCYFSNGLSIYMLGSYYESVYLLYNSIIKSEIYFYETVSYSNSLDDASVKINGVEYKSSKNNYTSVKGWQELENEEIN